MYGQNISAHQVEYITTTERMMSHSGRSLKDM